MVDKKARAKDWNNGGNASPSSNAAVYRSNSSPQERGVSLWSFYDWRKRLRKAGRVRFALVERRSQCQEPASSSNADLEVVFATGERLRIRAGVDGATLRTVVEALRG